MVKRLCQAVTVLAAFAFLSAIPRPALAANFKSTIRAIADAPFRITACSGWVNSNLNARASYTDIGQKPIKAIKVRFIFEDDFDKPRDQMVGLDGDGMDVGQSNHGSWEFFVGSPDITEVVCEAYAAKFTDGTVWEAIPGAASPANNDKSKDP